MCPTVVLRRTYTDVLVFPLERWATTALQSLHFISPLFSASWLRRHQSRDSAFELRQRARVHDVVVHCLLLTAVAEV